MTPRASTDQFDKLAARAALEESATEQEAVDDTFEVGELRNKRKRHLWLKANRGGVTYEEIADVCGVSESLVTKSIARARQEADEVAGDPKAERALAELVDRGVS